MAATLAAVMVAMVCEVEGVAPPTTVDMSNTPFSALAVACTVSAGRVTAPAYTTNCNVAPDLQSVTLYKLALCTAKPSPPSTVAAAGLSSCQLIHDDPRGQVVAIANGSRSPVTLPGATKPANATYGYLYVELSPTQLIQTRVTFGSVVGDANSTTHGSVCWSIASPGTTLYNWSDHSQGAMPPITRCGSAVDDAYAPTSITYNSFNGGVFVNALTNLPISNGMPAVNAGAGVLNALDAYLVAEAGTLARPETPALNQANGVSRLVGILTLPQALTVSDATTNVMLYYNNSLGTQIATQTVYNGYVPVSRFGPGPFDITVAASP